MQPVLPLYCPGTFIWLPVNGPACSPALIHYGFCDSTYGPCLLGWTERGLCYLGFVDAADNAIARAELHSRWPRSKVQPAQAEMAVMQQRYVQPLQDGKPVTAPIVCCGSPFRLQVWQALLTIPTGHTVSYGQLAAILGTPGAARAIGGAVAANPIGWLIPCHRVINQDGSLGGYYWGSERKRLLLEQEGAFKTTIPAG